MEINEKMYEDMRKYVTQEHERRAEVEHKLRDAVQELEKKDAIIKELDARIATTAIISATPRLRRPFFFFGCSCACVAPCCLGE